MTITIQQPKPFDIVGDPVLFAGIGQGFEAMFSWRVHDGHDERTGSINVGGGTGEHGQFQVAAAIGAAAFQLDRHLRRGVRGKRAATAPRSTR